MKYFLVILYSLFFQLESRAEGYDVFQENGKYGLKNSQGLVTIPAVYDALGWSDGNFSVLGTVTGFKQGDQWGLITTSNQKITNAEYFTLYPGNSTLILASKRSSLTLRISTGCVDITGKVIIPFNYSGLHIHSSHAITFTLDGNRLKYGLIDLTNKTILPQFYQHIYPIGSLRYAVQNFNNKTALFSENGKQVTDFVIDSISQVQHGLAVLYQNGRVGLIDRNGIIVKQPVYREIAMEGKKYMLRLPDEWHVLNADNVLLKKIEADSIVSVGPNRVKIVSSFGTQLADMDFVLVGTEKMNSLNAFQSDFASFRKNGKTGIIKSDGSVVLHADFERVLIDNEHFLVYSHQNGKDICTLYDQKGNPLTRKAYNEILPFNGSFFPVAKNGFYGGIDKAGSEIIACAYDSILNTYRDLVVIKFKGQFGVITTSEQWKVLPQPNRIHIINRERYFEFADDLTFLKAMDGTTIYFSSNKLQLQDDYLIEYITGGGKWKINLNGQIIFRELPSVEFTEMIFPSSEGLRGFKKNGKFGFIDDQGRLRIANRYEDIMPYREGLAAIKILGKWGFINKEDNIVVQPAFDEVQSFEHGFAKVKQSGKYGMLDREGKKIIDYRYDDVGPVINNRLLLVSGQHFGLADVHGNILLQAKYESIEDLDNGFVLVKQNGKFGVVNLAGVSTIPIHYDHLVFESDKNRFVGLKRTEFVPFQAQH